MRYNGRFWNKGDLLNLLEIILIAVGLAMDCFAVSLGIGTNNIQKTRRMVLRLAFHFGLFQGGMAFLGWLAGSTVVQFISAFDHWIAFGLLAYVGGKMIEIPVVPAAQVLDPTGCGDAFRAGLLYGIARELDWETTGQLASVMGAIKIEHRGGQNHQPTRDDIAARLRQAFGKSL